MSIYLFHCNSMLYSIVQLIWEQGLIFRCWIKTSAGSVFSSLNLSSRASSFYIFDLSYAWLILKVNGLFIRVQFMNEREIERQVDIITTYTHFAFTMLHIIPWKHFFHAFPPPQQTKVNIPPRCRCQHRGHVFIWQQEDHVSQEAAPPSRRH